MRCGVRRDESRLESKEGDAIVEAGMDEDRDQPPIKITDRRHFDRSGERRPDSEVPPPPPEGAEGGAAAAGAAVGRAPDASARSSTATETGPARPTGRTSSAKASKGAEPPPGGAGRSDPRDSEARPPQDDPSPSDDLGHTSAAGDVMDVASRLSSSFSLLVARLAQETEIYLGLVPFPGKETAEPDLEAARAMIDMLSMLQEKTRGNLDPEESHLLENLLYTYRLEFVRRRSGGGVR